MNNSEVDYGTSGSGKSESSNVDVAAMVGQRAIMMVDFQGTSAMSLLRTIGDYRYVLVDDLKRRDRVLPLRLLKTSDSEWERKRFREEFAEILFRKTEENAHEHPLKLFGVETACKLYQSLTHLVPLCAIAELFMPWSPWHDFLLAHSTDRVVVGLLRKLKGMHEATRQNIYGPAERLLQSVLTEPSIVLRDADREPDTERMIRDKYVVLVIGGRDVSVEAFRMVAAMRVLNFIHHFENERGGQAHVVLEEFSNYNLVGKPEIRALNTCRKMGLSFCFRCQSPPRDDEIREAIEQNCGRRIAHRCGSRETAEHVANWLMVDPNKVHHQTERSVFDGYETVRQTGWSSGDTYGFATNWRDIDRATQRVVHDDHYVSLSDQRTLLADQIQNELAVGERFVNDNGRIYREKVQLPKERYPWPGIMEAKIAQRIEEMLQSDWYVTPVPVTAPPAGWSSSESSDRPPCDKASSPDGSVPLRRRRSGSTNKRSGNG
jgi:hypothetical protein